MNSHIEWTATAQQSLEAVFEYTYSEFGERQLRKLHRQILSTVRRIAAFPLIGPMESFSRLLDKEYRGILVIKEVKIIRNRKGENKGYGFIEYERTKDFREALEKGNKKNSRVANKGRRSNR